MAVPDSTAYLCYACRHEFTPDRSVSLKEVMAGFRQVGYRELKHDGAVYEFTERLGKGTGFARSTAKSLRVAAEVTRLKLPLSLQPSAFSLYESS